MEPPPKPATLQQIVDRLTLLEKDNAALKVTTLSLSAVSAVAEDTIYSLSQSLNDLNQRVVANSSCIQDLSETFTTQIASITKDISFIIEDFGDMGNLKNKQTELVNKQTSLLTETKQQIKTWASTCKNSSTTPLPEVEKIVQEKLAEDRVRRFRELNLWVRGLCSSSIDPLPTGYTFLNEQLENSNITLDRAWFGHDGTLFIRFLSLVDRLQALRAKKKLFLLPTKIFLDEDLTKSQVVELKHSRSLVVEARSNGK